MSRKASLLALLLFAFLLRIPFWPASHEERDFDEVGYLSGGLLLFEGIAPGYKMAPAGPITWYGWMYAAVGTLRELAANTPSVLAEPRAVRPFIAVERALFSAYRDFAAMRRGALCLVFTLSLFGVWAAFRIGERTGGLWAALAAGGLFASAPIFVEYSARAGPYMFAWVFVLLSHYFLLGKREVLSAVLFGAAAASRIDMLLYAPILLIERNRKQGAAKYLLLAAAAAIVVSPWLLTNALGNLRAIVSIRLASGTGFRSPLEGLTEAFIIPALVLAAGAFFGYRSANRQSLLRGGYIALLFLTLVKSSGFGGRHDGAVFLAIVTGLASAVPLVAARHKKAAIAVAALVVLGAVFQVPNRALPKEREAPYRAVRWVETHVRPGASVYLESPIRVPLPTAAAADRLWEEVTRLEASRRKVASALRHHGLRSNVFPRALSEENLVQDRALRRRWFILGAAADERSPRFDIHLFSGVPTFDLTYDTVVGKFRETGGALIWHGEPVRELGPPCSEWWEDEKTGVFVYCTEDSRAAPPRQ